MKVTVKVSALAHPTEIEEKVKTAITGLFSVELAIRESGLPQIYGEGDLESLRLLHQRLREEQILDTSRNILLAGISGSTTQFRLNKQVAFMGKVNFPAGEESLGSIHVEITAENMEDLLKIIDWLAPQTSDGKPVGESEL
ncbi:MAG: RNA-binding domain-containing protein [Candidatus Methanoperedens sp.]|nr:RNA-binding domain-containing protein [Candidatus Methanoperedens sp.]